jgi:Predicted membrane protein (DUF2157)
MDHRIAVQQLAASHQLDRLRYRQLLALAGLQAQPAAVLRWGPRVTGVLGATLLGLGLVFWIAANWDTLGRFGQFALLQAVLLASGVAAWLRSGLQRAAAALLTVLATGALWGFFGQTYQTGADAWTLFALWAALVLPLALAVRSDVVWVPWAAVAMTAVALWMQTHTAHRWRFEGQDLQPQLIGWAAALLVVGGLSVPARHFTGAGPWSLRCAVVLASAVLGGTALGGLFQVSVGPQYPLGLLVLLALAAGLASRRAFDLFGLSALTLAINVLLVAGLARWLFMPDVAGDGDPTPRLLLIGLAAAALLAFSVSRLLALARRRRDPGPP